MIELTWIYIISQIITIVYFGFLCLSYLLKDRKKILISNFFAHIGQTVAMAMLNGYTGASMSFVMMLRDVTYLCIERKLKKEDKKYRKIDLSIFFITIILIIGLTIWSYNGPLSLLSVIATLITTYALWQKNVKIYKLLGIIAGVIWLLYNIFIMSIMGIILESILLIFTVIGYIKDKNVKKEKKI